MAEDKKIKDSALAQEVPIVKDDRPVYTVEQNTYLSNLITRLSFARDERNKTREEFDGMSFLNYWYANERWANTYIKPKVNKNEITFQSGILRTKLFAFISSIISLNLKADILTYDENATKLSALGNAMEDIMEKTEELEGDEEKQLLRIYELMKQGTLFVEEVWKVEHHLEKTITKEFDGKFDSKNWKQEVVSSDGSAVSNIISSRDVYLGDLRKYVSEDQPYIFTVQSKSYEECKKIYGEWDMWKYVPTTKREFIGGTESRYLDGSWTLLEHPDGDVEIIRYQDKVHNEFQIIINGIPMLPIGYPLPWGCRYNIEQQNLEPIRQDFAYGKSFIFKNKNTVALLDEMLRKAALKTYQSFMPPYLNNSGSIISRDVLTPGKITMGLPKGALTPISDNAVQGVTNGEFNMIEQVKRYVDENTASQTFTGMKEGGSTTATQVIELQRQARIMLGVIILSVSLMEKKIKTMRLYNILQNWFDPVDTVVDETKSAIKDRYRIVSRDRGIPNKGSGTRYVIPTEEPVSVEKLTEEEDAIEERTGTPARIIVINPKELKQAKLIWFLTINAREKKSSELNKLMFRQKMTDAIELQLPLNPEYVKEQFAEVWGDDPSKMYTQNPPPPVPGAEVPGQASAAGVASNQGSVAIKKPGISMEQANNSITNSKVA